MQDEFAYESNAEARPNEIHVDLRSYKEVQRRPAECQPSLYIYRKSEGESMSIYTAGRASHVSDHLEHAVHGCFNVRLVHPELDPRYGSQLEGQARGNTVDSLLLVASGTGSEHRNKTLEVTRQEPSEAPIICR